MWKHFLKIFSLSLAVFLLLFGSAGSCFGYYMRNRYYPGTKVAGESIAFLTREQAEQKLQNITKSYLDHAVVVQVPDLNTKPVSPGEYPVQEIKSTVASLGLNLDAKTALDQAFTIGRDYQPSHWLKDVSTVWYAGKDHSINYQISEEAINTFINTDITPKVVSPTPAKLRIDGTAVLVDDSKPGLTVDTKALFNQVKQSISAVIEAGDLVIQAPSQIVNSTTQTSTVQPIANQLDKLGNQKLSFSSGEKTFSPSRAEVLTWYSPVQDESGNLSLVLDKAKLSAYLQKNGGTMLDLAKANSAAALALNQTIQEAAKTNPAVSALNLTLAQKTPEAPKLPTTTDLSGKHIEVSIADQKMYLLDGSTVVATYTVSSGAWATPTPRGTFSIASKSQRAYSSTYHLYMPYWMNFVGTPTGASKALPTGMFGLHELPEWPNGYKEGQNHLGTPVSHGCVRLGVGDAAEVYNWTAIGTTLVIR